MLYEPRGEGRTGDYVLQFDISWNNDAGGEGSRFDQPWHRITWGYDWRFDDIHTTWQRQRIGVNDKAFVGTGDYSLSLSLYRT